MSVNPRETTVSTVPAENSAMPVCSTARRERRASRKPVGTPATAIPNVNTVERRPMLASENPYSRRTSGAMRGNNCRSIALTTYDPSRTANTTTLRAPDSVARGVSTVRTPLTCDSRLRFADLCSLLRIPNPDSRIPTDADVPVEDLLARPEDDAWSRLNVFERLAEVAESMSDTHDVGVNDQRHDARRFLRVGIELFELIDRAVPIFRRSVMLDQHHRDVVAFL